jgi:hypothetical protein
VYLSLRAARSESDAAVRENAAAAAGAHSIAVMGACLQAVMNCVHAFDRLMMLSFRPIYPLDDLARSLWQFAPVVVCIAASLMIMGTRSRVYASAGAVFVRIGVIALACTLMALELTYGIWLS